MEEEKKTTDAQTWRNKAQKIHTLTLESGNVVKAKRPSMTSLLRRGLIPTHLFTVALGSMGGGVNPKAMTAAEAKAFCEFLALYVTKAVLEPKLSLAEQAPEGAVSIEDVSDEDQIEIFHRLEAISQNPEKGEDRAGRETFPKESSSAPAGSSGEEVREEAVGAPGPN